MNWDKIEARSKQLKNKIALQWGRLGNVGQKQALVKRVILAAFGTTLAFSGASADEFGLATYYHNPNHGGLIAAHRTLSFGTQVRVHNLDNGRSAA